MGCFVIAVVLSGKDLPFSERLLLSNPSYISFPPPFWDRKCPRRVTRKIRDFTRQTCDIMGTDFGAFEDSCVFLPELQSLDLFLFLSTS